MKEPAETLLMDLRIFNAEILEKNDRLTIRLELIEQKLKELQEARMRAVV